MDNKLRITGDVVDVNQKLISVNKNLGMLQESVGNTQISLTKLAGSFVSLGTAITAIKTGITYLAQIETASLGIASAFMTGGKYIDATSGKALDAQSALNAAQGDSKEIVEELQYANIQTIATLDELVNAYQTTLPVALARGFDREQVKEFTVAMVQAAGAIGLQMNQLSEETRSLLTANIDPRNSRIATVLGLRNEDINKFKGDANGLFNFLMDKLSAYRVAGIESQKTWNGLWSNLKDIFSQAMGKQIEPLFEALKYEMKALADSIVTIDDKAKKIKWNPEFLEGVNSFKEGIQSVIAEVYRLGMLLDKAGGSFTRMIHGATFSELTGSDRWSKANDEYRTRYMKSEQALQDMAMRTQGWKPVTADVDKQMRAASTQGIKRFEQAQVNVGEDEAGTQQLLRYYREIAHQKAKWDPNARKPETDKKLEHLQEEWKKTARDLDTSLAKQDDENAFEKISDVKNREADLIEKFKKIPGAKDKIESWAAGMIDEFSADSLQKEVDKLLTAGKEGRKALEELERGLTDTTATELDKRLAAVDETATKQEKLAAQALMRRVIDEEEYDAKVLEIAQAAMQQQEKILTEHNKTVREAEINSRLAALDLAEKEGLASRYTLRERINLTKELIEIEEKHLATMNKGKDETAWYSQVDKVNAARKTYADLVKEAATTNPYSAMQQAMIDLKNKWSNIGQQIYDVAQSTAQAMQSAFSDFFFDAFQGKLKTLGDYVTSFCNSVQRAIANALAQQVTAGIMGGGLGKVALSGVGGFLESLNLGALFGVSFHQGGMVGEKGGAYRIVPNFAFAGAPRLHGGGWLATDEVPAILQKGELVLSRRDIKDLSEGNGLSQGNAETTPHKPTINENHYHYETTVHLNVNALDSRSVAQTLHQQKQQIVGMVQEAYNKMGQRGPLGR